MVMVIVIFCSAKRMNTIFGTAVIISEEHARKVVADIGRISEFAPSNNDAVVPMPCRQMMAQSVAIAPLLARADTQHVECERALQQKLVSVRRYKIQRSMRTLGRTARRTLKKHKGSRQSHKDAFALVRRTYEPSGLRSDIEIGVFAGEQVIVHEHCPGGWCFGEKIVKGYFPSWCIQQEDGDIDV